MGVCESICFFLFLFCSLVFWGGGGSSFVRSLDLWFCPALSGWGVAQWGRFGGVSRHLLVCRPAAKEGEEREERREG